LQQRAFFPSRVRTAIGAALLMMTACLKVIAREKSTHTAQSTIVSSFEKTAHKRFPLFIQKEEKTQTTDRTFSINNLILVFPSCA
jgi:hypothetical protein